MRPATFLPLLAMLLAGCTGHVVYQESGPVPGGAWHRAHVPEFTFTIEDTTARHDMFVDLRHTGEYPYSDLFLFVDFFGPGGRHLRDTVECLLADPTGRWYGTGTGFILARRERITAKVLLRYRERFPAPGRYVVRLEQAMRTEELPGVIDVGLSVERSS